MENFTNQNHGSKNSQSYSNLMSARIQTRSFLVQKCSLCDKIMELREGDTIYGNKWYHENCWNLVKNGECAQ